MLPHNSDMTFLLLQYNIYISNVKCLWDDTYYACVYYILQNSEDNARERIYNDYWIFVIRKNDDDLYLYYRAKKETRPNV